MKKKIFNLLFFVFTTLLFGRCNDRKQTNAAAKENQSQNDKTISTKDNIDLQVPDFTDPEVKKYYESYTAYIKEVVLLIRNKDEAATLKLLNDKGKQFGYNIKWEEKARSTPEEEQKFSAWLMQSMPYQKEIIQSEYFKKFNEEHYKKTKDENK